MGFRDAIEQPQLRGDVSWSPINSRWYSDPGEWGETYAGFPAGPQQAQRNSTVAACVSLIRETLASLSLQVLRPVEPGSDAVELATDHPLYWPLTFQPNPRHDRFLFVEILMHRLALWGNAFVERRPEGLIPRHPRCVTVEELGGYRLRYRVELPMQAAYTVTQDDMIHLRDGGDDDASGTSRATLARQAIGIAGAAEAMAAGYFKNDATGRLIFKFPRPLTETKKAEHRKMIDETVGGWKHSRRPMYVDDGATVDEIGGPGEAAFLIDPRNHQVQELCRFYRVWPFMIGHEAKVTWGTNIAQTKQAYVDFTARPWGERFEHAFEASLLTEQERRAGYKIRFDYKELLRGDLLTTVQALAIERQQGFINPNEGRRVLGMNPRTDPGGTEYQETPTGAAPPADRDEPPPDEEPDDEPPPRRRREEARDLAPFVADAAQRIAQAERREIAEKRAAQADGGPKWRTWLRRFAGEQRAYAAKVAEPLVTASGGEPWVAASIGERVETSLFAALDAGIPEGWAEGRTVAVRQIIEETLAAGATVRRAA